MAPISSAKEISPVLKRAIRMMVVVATTRQVIPFIMLRKCDSFPVPMSSSNMASPSISRNLSPRKTGFYTSSN